MHYYEIAPVKIVRQEASVFTYAFSDKLSEGQIVAIEVGSKIISGIVMQEVPKPTYTTKEVNRILDYPPLPLQLVEAAKWMSDYYSTHLALVLQTIIPRGIEKTRRKRQKQETSTLRNRTNIVFNDQQQKALATIRQLHSGVALLHGITGSGKTAVYIQIAKETLAQGKSVIVLVPEIALAPQVVDEFSTHFDNIILTHSNQTEAERHIEWVEALTTSVPRVVIGPRSALFMPLASIGLIVIDEEHEPSYKQEQSPRYDATRVASILSRKHNAKLILGSATPLVSDYYLAEQTNKPIIEMTKTAKKSMKPKIDLVDMTKRDHFKRHRFLSDQLLNQLEQTFLAGNQALIFHNRRGSASTTLCEDCGWQATCPRCYIPLTLHSDLHHMRCHVCDYTDIVPTNCPVCQKINIIHKGIGTKLIASELKKMFPKVTVARFDGDTSNNESLQSRYKELYDGTLQLVIGTQIIAKGLDLPKLRTVGVIQADTGLSLPDFSSSERTFQLLAQVVGRVGRSDHDTTVVVQSYQPSHDAVVDGLSQNYADFYQKTLDERQRAQFPPFVFLLKLTCIYKTELTAIKNSQKLATELRQRFGKTIQVLGPTPSFYERQHDTYRWQLVLKSKNRSHLIDALHYVPSSHWQFELDPSSLL